MTDIQKDTTECLLEMINYKIRNSLKKGAFYILSGLPYNDYTVDYASSGLLFGKQIDLKAVSFSINVHQELGISDKHKAIDDLEYSSYYFSKSIMSYLKDYIYSRIWTVIYDTSFSQSCSVGDAPFIIAWNSELSSSVIPGLEYGFHGMLIPNEDAIAPYKKMCVGCSNRILCMFGRRKQGPCRIVKYFE